MLAPTPGEVKVTEVVYADVGPHLVDERTEVGGLYVDQPMPGYQKADDVDEVDAVEHVWTGWNSRRLRGGDTRGQSIPVRYYMHAVPNRCYLICLDRFQRDP